MRAVNLGKKMSMMSSDISDKRFAESIEREQRDINARCGEWLDRRSGSPANIEAPLRYTLLDGGKRLRPMLCLWTHDVVGGGVRDAALDAACALECLHTYSLVHDDLPCMDDDDMRRGKPSCHVAFGEGIAVLTGDALLTMCFEIVGALNQRWQVPVERVVELVGVIASAAGHDGLITGQALDLMSDTMSRDLETVERVHRHKTAALIAASMEVGAVVAGAESQVRNAVRATGLLAGQAFQIIDDILDVQMDRETLGKTPGKDEKDGKLTYPAVEGINASKARAVALIASAKSALPQGSQNSLLTRVFDHMVERSA